MFVCFFFVHNFMHKEKSVWLWNVIRSFLVRTFVLYWCVSIDSFVNIFYFVQVVLAIEKFKGSDKNPFRYSFRRWVSSLQQAREWNDVKCADLSVESNLWNFWMHETTRRTNKLFWIRFVAGSLVVEMHVPDVSTMATTVTLAVKKTSGTSWNIGPNKEALCRSVSPAISLVTERGWRFGLVWFINNLWLVVRKDNRAGSKQDHILFHPPSTF